MDFHFLQKYTKFTSIIPSSNISLNQGRQRRWCSDIQFGWLGKHCLGECIVCSVVLIRASW
jgi:hypothetical protein